MKKRILSLLLALVLLAALLPQTALTTHAATSGSCGDNLTWSFNKSTGVLTIKGSGDMTEWGMRPTPWYDFRTDIKSLTISEGVTGVGSNSFLGCTELKSLTLPKSLTYIGQEAFAQCSALTELILPDAVSKVYGGAFRDCTSLKNLVISKKLTEISGNTFDGCTGLKTVTIPEGVKTIGGSSFQKCTALTELTIPSTVTTVDYGAFLNCTKLKRIAILNKSAVLGSRCIGYKESGDSFSKISGVTIYGLSGSTAKTYASKNGVTFQSALDAPVVTASNDAATGKVKLTWTAVPLAVSYKVYRAESKDGPYKLMKTVTDGTAYTNTGAVAGEKYWYKVKAVNGSLGGKYSAVKSRTCDLPRPVVSITRTSAGKPKLTWKKVAGAVSYKVYRCDTKTGTYKLLKTVTDGLSYTNTSAEKGKTYYYKVKAVHKNAEALSAFSLVKSITAK